MWATENLKFALSLKMQTPEVADTTPRVAFAPRGGEFALRGLRISSEGIQNLHEGGGEKTITFKN